MCEKFLSPCCLHNLCVMQNKKLWTDLSLKHCVVHLKCNQYISWLANNLLNKFYIHILSIRLRYLNYEVNKYLYMYGFAWTHIIAIIHMKHNAANNLSKKKNATPKRLNAKSWPNKNSEKAEFECIEIACQIWTNETIITTIWWRIYTA